MTEDGSMASPPAPDQPPKMQSILHCSECRYSWTHIKFRKTGTHGAITLCTLSNKPKDAQTTACSLAKAREPVLRPARREDHATHLP